MLPFAKSEMATSHRYRAPFQFARLSKNVCLEITNAASANSIADRIRDTALPRKDGSEGCIISDAARPGNQMADSINRDDITTRITGVYLPDTKRPCNVLL